MNCWEILGIEPTVEIKTIKKAYALKLRIHHPEEDPEGFNRLRIAYEAALNEAKVLKVVPAPVLNTTADQTDTKKQLSQSVVDIPSLDPSSTDQQKISLTTSKDELVAQFMEQVTKIYNNFSLRINERAWSELLESDSYWRIDLRLEIQYRLLHFLMTNFRLPHKIWQLFDEHFSWKEQHLSLCKTFPEEFIIFVISKIENHSPDFSYDFLNGACDFDLFIDYREEAFYALRKRDLDLAKQLLDAANQIYAGDPDLRRLLARYYCLTNQIDAALAEYNQILTINDQDLDAHLNRALLLQKSGNYKTAINDYQWLLTQLPDDPRILSGLANCYSKLGILLEAKTLYEQIFEAYPYDVDALFQIAGINYQLVAQYRQDLSINPNNTKLRYEIASLLYELREYQDCYEEIKVIQNRPDLDSATLLLIGQVLCQLGKVDEGLEWTNQALERSHQEGGNGYQILVERGNILNQNGRYHEAIEDFLAALKINAYNPELLYSLAESYRRIDLLPQCIDYATRAIALKDDNWLYYSTRGLAYFYSGYYQEAKADHQIVVDHSKTFAQARFRLAFCHLNLEEYEQAIECFSEAWDYDNAQVETYFFKAFAYIQINNFEAALENINSYIEQEPDSVVGYFLKGYIYQLLEMPDQASLEYCNGSELIPDNYLLAKTAFYSINQQGLSPESIKFLNQLVNLTPYDELVQTMVAVAFMQLDDETAAQRVIEDYHLAIKDYSQVLKSDFSNYLLGQAKVLTGQQRSDTINYQQRYQLLVANLKANYNFLNTEQIANDETSLKFFRSTLDNYLNGFTNFAVLSTNTGDLRGLLNWIDILMEMGEFDLALPKYYLILNEIKNQTINFAEHQITLYQICHNTFKHEWLLRENERDEQALELITRFIDSISSYEESFVAKVLAEAWNRKGAILESSKRYSEALSCYNQAIKSNANTLSYWYDKAELLEKLNSAESLRCYRQLLELAPNDNELWRKTGIVLEDLSDYSAALSCYNGALKIAPHDSWTWANKGKCLENMGKYKEALGCYDKAILYEPTTSLFWNYKIKLLLLLDRIKEAMDCSNEALKIHPNCSVLWNCQGELFNRFENYQKALDCFDKAIKYADQDEDVEGYLNNKAKCLVNLNDFDAAFDCLNEALKINPEHDITWCNKGVAYYFLEMYEAALECLDEALKINPDDPDYWENKGELLEKLNRNKEAQLCYQKARIMKQKK
ncbi:MAG TPA: tetratricopeptide repeat protein [Bacillota bacterium]|nr:tetratricopeptide repeat protein [Bacillota bacterium]